MIDKRAFLFTQSPLTDLPKSTWYSEVFLLDFTAKRPVFCPTYVTEDNLACGPRYRQVDEINVRDYWIRLHLDTFVQGEEAWEVLEVWWASDEVGAGARLSLQKLMQTLFHITYAAARNQSHSGCIHPSRADYPQSTILEGTNVAGQ